MSSEPLKFQDGFFQKMQSDLDSIPPEHGYFSVRYWSDSYAIEFTPVHSSETLIWQTFYMKDFLSKVKNLMESPEDASTLLHQQRPVDPDGAFDDLR